MALSLGLDARISMLITNRWLRLNGLDSGSLPQRVVDLIIAHCTALDGGGPSSSLTVNVLVVGDEIADKIGIISNYIDDGDVDVNAMESLRKRSEFETVKFWKSVHLSSTKRVSISIQCLSEQRGSALLDILTDCTIDAVMFCFNLCHQSSLHSVKKWYRESFKLHQQIQSQNESKPFIPLLVGTHFGSFRERAAKHRISVMEQSRKYAAKMGAVLLFVETEPLHQIHIKELFLIILSRHYHFDANIPPISGSKLPIIEYHDHSPKSSPTNRVTRTHSKPTTTPKAKPVEFLDIAKKLKFYNILKQRFFH